MKKIIILMVLSIFLIPSVLADLITPPLLFLGFGASILMNYMINFFLIFIQSKIWLKLKFKKIALGLLIVTPIIFFLETYPLFSIYNYKDVSYFLFNFVIIAPLYFLLSKIFWKLDIKHSIVTSIIMGIITNPAIGFIILFIVGLIMSAIL